MLCISSHTMRIRRALRVRVRTRKEAADLSIPNLVGAPCFSRGSWTSVQRKRVLSLKNGL
jgi:hypothetical protein